MTTALKLPFFSQGEVSPKVYGRVDTAAYQSGLKTARNAIVSVAGGVMNRPGTIMIGNAKYADSYIRLIPFSFRTNDTHMLEFGDGYIRVIREDFYQTDLAPKTITGISTGTQTVITTSTAHGYADGEEVVITGIVGTVELNNGRFKVDEVTSTTFRLLSVYTGLDIDSTEYAAYISGGASDRIYEITTPYSDDHLPQLKYAQSADILTLTHPLYPPKELKRFGLANWELDDIEFAPSMDFPIGVTVDVGTVGTDMIGYQVTAISDENGTESFPGLSTETFTITAVSNANPVVITTSAPHSLDEEDVVYLAGILGDEQLNGRRFVAINITSTTFALKGEDGTGSGAYTSGGTAWPTFVKVASSHTTNNTISWPAVDGASLYSIYREKYGRYSWIGETDKTTFVDENIDADTEIHPPVGRNPFLGEDNYPGVVGFYQQRRIFGGSYNAPDTWEASQPADYSNFGRSNPIRDDDAISATLNSGQVNQIKHLVPTKGLGMFTTGGEWNVSSGGEVAFSPFTVRQDISTNWGCAEHNPWVMGNSVVFVQEDNRTIRSLRPSRSYDEADTSIDLTVTADHLFSTYEIQDWALARAPYSAIICTRTDGKAVMLVHDEDQKVTGWTWWDTKGTFESVGVVRVCVEHETPEPDDGIYFVVKRKINGTDVQFVERLHKRRFVDIRDAYFVDCGRSYDRPLKITTVDLRVDNEDGILITAIDHGLETDDVITFTDIVWEPEVDSMGNETQPAQLNDIQYVVVDVTEDTFTFKKLILEPEIVVADDTWKAWVRGGVVRKNVTEMFNLDHLEGETVSILADSYPITDKVVTNGRIELPGYASRIHVGLPYTCDIETLPIEPITQNETWQGKRKKITAVVLRLDKSREALVGPNNLQLIPMKRAPYVETSPALFTGDREITLSSNFTSSGGLFFRVRDPVPFNLLAIFPRITVGNDS